MFLKIGYVYSGREWGSFMKTEEQIKQVLNHYMDEAQTGNIRGVLETLDADADDETRFTDAPARVDHVIDFLKKDFAKDIPVDTQLQEKIEHFVVEIFHAYIRASMQDYQVQSIDVMDQIADAVLQVVSIDENAWTDIEKVTNDRFVRCMNWLDEVCWNDYYQEHQEELAQIIEEKGLLSAYNRVYDEYLDFLVQQADHVLMERRRTAINLEFSLIFKDSQWKIKKIHVAEKAI